MKLTKDLKELIRRKLEVVKDRKEKKIKETIRKSLIPFSDKLRKIKIEKEKIEVEAEKVAIKLGAYSISIYSNRDNYITLKDEIGFNVDEKYYSILEEIEVGTNTTLKQIFKRIDNMQFN